ncbi:MAG: hypothetical protein PF484_11705 [Bacteroidales bacterium]|jgi:hypothetical protein|nr:hypothetical protein [Bacteroidales bacterium]
MVRFLGVQDIDKNGRMNILSTDKHSNIRWERDVDGVFKRK